MNIKYNPIRFILAAIALGAFAITAQAGPGPQYWATLHNEADFKELKVGDTVAYVCNMCKTVSEIPITSTEQAMKLCKEGETVTCPNCNMTTHVTMKRSRNDPSTPNQLAYVNDKGEECAFMVKVSEKK